jgi:hypothetical protein
MKSPNTIEAEIDAIRDQIYEVIKDMTPEEETVYFRNETTGIIAQYGLKLVKSAGSAPLVSKQIGILCR